MRYYKKYQRGVYHKKSLKDLKRDHKLARERRRRRLAWWKKEPAQLQAREEMSAQLMKGWMAAQNLVLSLTDEQMGLRVAMLTIFQAIERKDQIWKNLLFIASKGGNGNLSAHLQNTSKEMCGLNERIKGVMCMATQRGIRALQNRR